MRLAFVLYDERQVELFEEAVQLRMPFATFWCPGRSPNGRGFEAVVFDPRMRGTEILTSVLVRMHPPGVVAELDLGHFLPYCGAV